MAGAVAQGGAADVHGRVARADHHQPAAQVVDVGVLQIIDGEVHVAQALPFDVQGIGPPHAGADEDRLVAVAEKVLDAQRLAHVGVGADLDVLQAQVPVLEIVQHRLGQPEFGDAVAQHAADLVVTLEDGHVVAVAGQDDGDGQARGARADDGGLFAVGFGGAFGHLAGVGGRNVVFNDGEMHRRPLDALDTVPLALILVVADQRTDRRQGVVLKQHPARLIELVGFEQADHFRDVGVDRAALLAARVLAAQAVVRFVHYMQCHSLLLFRFRTDFAR